MPFQVVLLQGLDEAAAKECAKGTHHGGQHLHHLLKFLTLRHEVDNPAKGRAERSGIMAVGGSYDPALDGPLVDSSGYVLTFNLARYADDAPIALLINFSLSPVLTPFHSAT